VYSDGSADVEARKGVASSIILTEFGYVNTIVKEYKIVKASDAEFHGVIQALEFIHDQGIPYSRIVCHTDALLVLQAFANRDLPSQHHSHIVRRFLDGCTKLGLRNIDIKHIKAHQLYANANSLCDLLANLHRLDLKPGDKIYRNRRTRDSKPQYVKKGEKV
jgi:ribonuclease HI